MVDGHAGCAAADARANDARWLTARRTDADDSVRAKNAVVRADRDRRGLGRDGRPEDELAGVTELLPGNFGLGHDLDSVLHAACRAIPGRREGTGAGPRGFLRWDAGVWDVPRNGHLEVPLRAARKPVGAVGAAEIDGRPA